MSEPSPDPARQKEAEERRHFLETLAANGQLVDVPQDEDTSKLPAKVTHVRYPDGTVKRIRFTGTAY